MRRARSAPAIRKAAPSLAPRQGDVRGFAPDEDLFAPVRKLSPDGLGNDIACSSTGILQLAGSPEVVARSPEKPSQQAGFFRFRVTKKFQSQPRIARRPRRKG
jgi:hypothetical protein